MSISTIHIPLLFYNPKRVTGNQVTLEQIKNHNELLIAVPERSLSAAESDGDESRILTFAELQELIELGKVDQIPNNKVIPDKLNVCFPNE